MDITSRFTVTAKQLEELRKVVRSFKDSPHPAINKYDFENEKATIHIIPPQLYGLPNPDFELTFTCKDDNYYIHYETPGLVLMPNAEGAQKPFDFAVHMNRGNVISERYKIIEQPKDNWAREFLQSNHKLGQNNSNLSTFLLACHVYQYLRSFFPFALNMRLSGNVQEYSLKPDFVTLCNTFVKEYATMHRKKTLTEGWDIVHLTEKQFNKILTINEEKKHEYSIYTVPLPKFCLEFYGDDKETDYYHFELKGKTITITVTDTDNFISNSFDVNITGIHGDLVDATLHAKEKQMEKWCLAPLTDDEDAEANWSWCANAFLAINSFMLNYGDVSMEVEEKQAIAPSEHRSHKKRERNSTRLFKSYTLKKSWVSAVARKKAEITCPAWGVRGHFRHLRNGKTIFVEAYVKGREKDKYKGKEYALLPYKDA